jgi:hypothetical protein
VQDINRSSDYLKKLLYYDIDTIRYLFATPLFISPVISHLRQKMESTFREVLSSFYELITMMYAFYIGLLGILEISILVYALKVLKVRVLRMRILTKIIPT